MRTCRTSSIERRYDWPDDIVEWHALAQSYPDEVRTAAVSSQALTLSASCCSICNEFLEDWHKHQPLLPADPVERAHARMVIDRFSSKYVPNFYSFLVRQVRCSCLNACLCLVSTQCR